MNKNTIKSVSLEERMNPGDKKIMASLKNVDVTFGKAPRQVHAVKDLSMNVYKGEVVGLVGESGSGKSTTGNALLGLLKRSSGEIKIDDLEIPMDNAKIKGALYKKLVQKAQIIFQDPANSLNPHKNIYKVISEGLDNFDIRTSYIKLFDINTLKNINKIIKTKTLTAKISEAINEVEIVKYIEDKKYNEVNSILYSPLAEILKSSKSKEAKKALTYLEIRIDDRKEISNSKKGVKKLKKKIVIDMLNSVGLSERVLDRFPLEFSGGQQQRIGISRAMVLRPELLVADEPISALDVSIQAQVVNIFNELKEKLGLTIVFIAHDLRMVEYISNRIAVMYRGTLVEIGDTNEISKNPIHPYTKSLLAAVPSIDLKKASLSKVQYDASVHNYSDKNKPSWFKVGSKDRFVLGTKEEIEQWVKEDKDA